VNGKIRLAGLVKFNCHNARRVVSIHCNVAAIKIQSAQTIQDLFAQIVLANTACDHTSMSQSLGMIGEICRSATQLFAVGQEIPEQFPEANRHVLSRYSTHAAPF
jgi:hypothetical protein